MMRTREEQIQGLERIQKRLYDLGLWPPAILLHLGDVPELPCPGGALVYASGGYDFWAMDDNDERHIRMPDLSEDQAWELFAIRASA